jgi:hypothetical protein
MAPEAGGRAGCSTPECVIEQSDRWKIRATAARRRRVSGCGEEKVGDMIVRIHMEDQYRLGDAAVAEVDKLDDALVAAMEARDTVAFGAALRDLLAYVREHGVKVPTDEIIPSDVILPSEDMTVDDAREIMERPITAPSSAPSSAQPPD